MTDTYLTRVGGSRVLGRSRQSRQADERADAQQSIIKERCRLSVLSLISKLPGPSHPFCLCGFHT